MTFNDIARFELESVSFNHETGEQLKGDVIEISGVEVHSIKDDSTSHSGQPMVKLRASRGVKVPFNAKLIWRGKEYSPIKDNAYHSFFTDSQRHWRSMRYMLIGEYNER